MQNRNPYAAPRTNVADADSATDYGEIKILSAHGRIGRVRYIGYTTSGSLLIAILLGAAVAATGDDPAVATLVAGAGYIAIIVIQILLTIQRAHDMNTSGWLSLIVFIPLAALVFWFVPGSPGENDYGKRPPPNTTGAIVLACILPLVFIVGMVAAIAIPAYQDYAQRAAQAQTE